MNDLLAKSYERLELDKVLARLERQCAFSAGAELARATQPSGDPETVGNWQAETAEAVRARQQGVRLSLGGAHDVRDSIFKAQRGLAIESQRLLDLRDTLRCSTTLRRTVGRLSGQYPLLAALINDAEDCADLQTIIGRSIGENGEILDTASARLASLRRELKVSFERLQHKLQRIINAPGNATVLQEPLISMRNGRYVIPIRVESRAKLAGVVHDTSASGATLWIEPLAAVELNNAWRELQLDEDKEIRRILAAISERACEDAEAIIRTVEVLAQLDVIRARSLLADAMGAVAPTLLPRQELIQPSECSGYSGSALHLRAARHPLLSGDVVPIDVELDASGWIMVVTGPNTGGKTVALKTVGLLTLMAQCGLHVPAKVAEMTIFSAVYADIGDEQSIEQSLSTFSSHMTNIIEILRFCDECSLVLWDELGAGTDPTEGAALARALLNELRRRRVTALVTTHHPELKLFAVQNEGLRNASVEFDLVTLSPTYRLLDGLPGRSNALLIAEGLGLPAGILADARQMVPTQERDADDLLDALHRSREQTERERSAAEALHGEVLALQAELQARLRDIDDERREVLVAARQEAEKQLEEVRIELRELRNKMQRASDTLEPIQRMEEALATIQDRQLETNIEPLVLSPLEDWLPAIGDSVWLERLAVKGLVLELDTDEALVQVGSLRVRAQHAELLPVRAEAETAALQEVPSPRSAPPPSSPGLELDLRGERVEAALERLERYLDAASAAGLPYGRIIHGKGTGVLRRAVRECLLGHPLVSESRNAAPGEGGDGVTIARLIA